MLRPPRAPKGRRNPTREDHVDELLRGPWGAQDCFKRPDQRRIQGDRTPYHPDRNKDEDASRRFAGTSEAYAVLSDPQRRRLYDVLGPDKYDDPLEVLFYRLNQEAGRREEEREYSARASAMQYDAAYSTGILVFFLLVLDFFIPSWVLGPWFYVFNAFLILAIAVGVRDSFR